MWAWEWHNNMDILTTTVLHTQTCLTWSVLWHVGVLTTVNNFLIFLKKNMGSGGSSLSLHLTPITYGLCGFRQMT